MMKRNQWLAALCVAAATGLAPTLSSAAVNIDIDVAPPAPRVEVMPDPRPGYVWAPGYWNWRGHEHVWVAGRFMRERRGQHWVPEHWTQNGQHWRMEKGHWEH
jgi:hypothetical protein